MSRLDEIGARLAAATPGPWVRHGREIHTAPIPEIEKDGYGSSWLIATVPEYAGFGEADLIAYAPADLTALLRVARAAEAEHRALAVYNRWLHADETDETLGFPLWNEYEDAQAETDAALAALGEAA